MMRFWHPFADMAALRAHGVVPIVRGEGYHIWDADGRRYVDATASLWYSMVGHGRSEIADAVVRQMREIEAYSTFQDLTNPVVEELTLRLADVAPNTDSVVFLTSGGSDSIDTATKMTRRYWHLVGEPSRRVLIRRRGAYHGMHAAGTSLAGIPPNSEGYGELLSDVVEVPWDDAEALAAAIDDVGAERVAGFFCEPVIGAGGILAPPDGYLAKTRQICRDTGVVFVADEVITGFGRVGAWFASGRWALEPDLIICAKGVTSGYLPLGAVIATPRIWEPFWSADAGMWRHGYTYSGHASVAAAALANLDLMEREKLIHRGMELETDLEQALAPLADHPLVAAVRSGCGAMGAVQLDRERLAQDRRLAEAVIPACRRNGIMTRMLAGDAIHVSPPLILDADGLAELTQGLDQALNELESQSPG